MKSTSNPAILVHKSAFMQRISDAVRRGHIRHTGGQIELHKLPAFVDKMNRQYATEQSPMQRMRLREAGFATGRLFLWYVDTGFIRDGEMVPVVVWVLLVTEGRFLVENRDQFRPALDARTPVRVGDYELVQQTKALEPKPVLTWRYQSRVLEGWREMIRQQVRRRQDDDLKQSIHVLHRSPGFAGIRSQVKALFRLIEGEWGRHRGSDPVPDLPGRIGYVSRLESKVKTWRVLMRELAVYQQQSAVWTGSDDDWNPAAD